MVHLLNFHHTPTEDAKLQQGDPRCRAVCFRQSACTHSACCGIWPKLALAVNSSRVSAADPVTHLQPAAVENWAQ